MFHIEVNKMDALGRFDRRIGRLELHTGDRVVALADFAVLERALGDGFALQMTYSTTKHEPVAVSKNF